MTQGHAEAVTQEEYLDRITASLPHRYEGIEQRRFDGGVLTIGRRTDFRWRWGGVRLTTTMAVAGFGSDADVAVLDRYLAAVVREASTKDVLRGRGLQRGAAGVAVAVFDSAPAAALDWASVAHGHQFAVAGYPVVVDLRTRVIRQPDRMRVGRLFKSHLRRMAQQTLSPPL